jgi:hypothetical protein
MKNEFHPEPHPCICPCKRIITPIWSEGRQRWSDRNYFNQGCINKLRTRKQKVVLAKTVMAWNVINRFLYPDLGTAMIFMRGKYR